MRYSDSYRRKPTPGAGQQGSPAPHYGTFNCSAPEVGQPFGAITLPAPPPGVRNRRILHLLWWTLPIVIVFLVAGTALIGLWLWTPQRVTLWNVTIGLKPGLPTSSKCW